MRDRFTIHARQAILFAQEDARAMGESGVGTQHFLLGLMRTNKEFADLLLKLTGLDLSRMRSLIAKEFASSEESTEEPWLCLTARRLVEVASEKARNMDTKLIRTEHLVYALASDRYGGASNIFKKLGVDIARAFGDQKLLKRLGIWPFYQPPVESIVRRQGGYAMWQRFTDRARKVILLAQEEARRMRSGSVGTEHLLLGMVRENEGVAAQVLQQMGLNLKQIRGEVEQEAAAREVLSSGEPNLSPRAKRTLELAADEARRMKHNYIGTEHLLLAILREEEGAATNVLRKLGMKLETVRENVQKYLGPEVPHTGNLRQTGPSQPEPDLTLAFDELQEYIQSKSDQIDSAEKRDRLKQLVGDLEQLRVKVGGRTSEFGRLSKKVLDGVQWYRERDINWALYEKAADLRDSQAKLAELLKEIGEIIETEPQS